MRFHRFQVCQTHFNDLIANNQKILSNTQQGSLDALTKCENYCKTNTKCTVCSVDCALRTGPNNGQCQWVALPECGTINHYSGPYGIITGDISMKNTGIVNVTISGPANVWFGVGFNANEMADKPWTIISNSTNVWEQKIGTCGSESDHGSVLGKNIFLIRERKVL